MAVAAHLKSMDLLMFARASEGLTHVRGMVVSFLAFVIGGAFLVLGLYVATSTTNVMGRMFLLFCWLLYALVAGTGVSATGIMLLDKARESQPRSTSDALIFGLMCLLKLWLIALGVFIAALLVMLVPTVIYFICKIPGVGPLLLFFAHPILILCAGALIFFTSIFMTLIVPALWDGDTITQAAAKTIAILKERAVATVLYLLVMGVVTAIILGILAAVILPGFVSMTGLATAIIGAKLAGGLAMLSSLPYAMMALTSGESGHMVALALGSAMLVMLGVAAALQIQLMGINLVYLGVSEGVDTSGAENMLKRQFDQAKAKADEAKQRATAAAERARQAAQQARAAQLPAQPEANNCPKCNAAYSADDVFCENCGQKLK
jgi:hypothetical protein